MALYGFTKNFVILRKFIRSGTVYKKKRLK
jgi:hypothetical protein